MEKIFEFFFFVAFEAFIAIDSEIFYSFNALLPSESLIKRSRFISRGVYTRSQITNGLNTLSWTEKFSFSCYFGIYFHVSCK